MLPPTALDGLSHAELKALVERLLGEVSKLKETVTEQRDEIARLKGLTARPKLKPSGMEQASAAKAPSGGRGKRRGRGAKKLSRVVV